MAEYPDMACLFDVFESALLVGFKPIDVPFGEPAATQAVFFKPIGHHDSLAVAAQIDGPIHRDVALLEFIDLRIVERQEFVNFFDARRLRKLLTQRGNFLEHGDAFPLAAAAGEFRTKNERARLPSVQADSAQGVTARVGMGFLVAARDDGGRRQNGLEKRLGEIGTAVVATLGDVAAEDLAPGSHESRFIRRATGVLIEEEHLCRAIEIASKKQTEIAVFKPKDDRVAVLGLADIPGL